ncbi:MAG: hypothetical protein KHY46_15405 [Clostridiales bacterium]|nr:hypothetical protein [Clostridiales bacterium]
MKTIPKKEEKYTGRYRTFLLSDQNIYHAIYSLRSYIFNFELLDETDKERYYQLQDKFNEIFIKKTIEEVRNKIINLIDKDDCFIEAYVYFKPKKLDNEGKVTYRPLHSTDIISQIAIVAMLHLLVYEIADVEKKLYLSNISRLLPENFYGNRVSLNPEVLFKPWKQQYQAYTQNANEALKKYHTSLEYKYEVLLDLENFFPTIDPMLVYELVVERLPVNLECSDEELLKRILEKLLFCKLKSKLSDKLKKEYYKVTKGMHECALEENFVRGIPQGLPQSYFFGNICMIPISEIFQKIFKGISYFYVDDSVIFTNDILEDDFGKQLNHINIEITGLEKRLLEKDNGILLPKAVNAMRKAGLYGIHVHGVDENMGVSKSSFVRLDQLDESEVYLKCVSREASQAGKAIFRMFSDEEDVILEERLKALSSEVKKKIKELDTRLEETKKEIAELQEVPQKEQNSEKIERCRKSEQNWSKFRDRWIRYYRFFEYRKCRLNLRHMCEVDDDSKRELRDIIYVFNKDKTEQDNLKVFMQSYNESIWDAAVSMYCEDINETEGRELGEYIRALNRLCFGEENMNSSFLYKVYKELIESGEGKCNSQNIYKRSEKDFVDSYRTLKYCAAYKMKSFSHKHYNVAEHWVEEIQQREKNWKNEILKRLLSDDMLNMAEIVNENTSQFLRMVANAVYSQLFDVEIEDRFVIRKFNRKALSCGEFRILVFLRNRLFKEEEFLGQKILLNDVRNKADLDYEIMEVIDIFESFVGDPIRIDKLILTHQYTCEVWKNGSKHLYFYTLHNQEHAIALIRNIVKLNHAISFLKISSLDFYILFLACYLHDISMVKIPALDAFLTDQENGDSIAWEHLSEIHQGFVQEGQFVENRGLEIEDISQVKKWMIQSYRRLDAYYEKKVREKHASDSAAEIRVRKDLDFLDATLREFVAEVAEAHQSDERDIYFTKSSATEKMVSLKFDKIMLRLADLLDMSNCRISRPILYHNLDQMSRESAFHWISHLLTQGYELKTNYSIVEDKDCLTPGSIVEKLVLTVIVDISQISKYRCEKPCEYMEIEDINDCGIELKIGNACEKSNECCNFLCKWFTEKNRYLMQELSALNEYLNRVPENYFGTEVAVCVKISNKTCLDEKQFGVLERYLR